MLQSTQITLAESTYVKNAEWLTNIKVIWQTIFLQIAISSGNIDVHFVLMPVIEEMF